MKAFKESSGSVTALEKPNAVFILFLLCDLLYVSGRCFMFFLFGLIFFRMIYLGIFN